MKKVVGLMPRNSIAVPVLQVIREPNGQDVVKVVEVLSVVKTVVNVVNVVKTARGVQAMSVGEMVVIGKMCY
jgi:hypothetical protein